MEVYAFVLMDDPYHLILRTPVANLGDAVRWVNGSYSKGFDWSA